MPDFDPDAYLAKKLGGFDPDAYLASKKPKKPAAPLQDLTADAPPKPNVMSMLNRIPGSKIITGPVEAGANMLSGAVAKPVSEVMGLAAQAKDYISGKPGDAEGFQRSIREGMTYQPRTAAGRAVAQYNPLALIGKGVDYLGGLAEAKPDASLGRRMLGAGMHEVVNQAPQFAALKAPPVLDAAGKMLKGAEGGGAGPLTARGLMQSAIKPSAEALTSGKAGKAIDTMLNEGYSPTTKGVSRMLSDAKGLNAQVGGLLDDYIAQHPQAAGSRAVVLQALDPVFQKFEKGTLTAKNLTEIQAVYDELMNHPLLQGNDIPLKMMQEMKQANYRELGEKSYGANKSPDASIDALKAVTRNLKEQIEGMVPEVKPLNKKAQEIYNVLNVSERRVLMEANKNPAGFGWLTTNPAKFAAWMVDRSAPFKSAIAQMLNTTADALPGMGKLAPLGAAAANPGASLASRGIPQPPAQAAQ